jgi:transglutaminase-like putative cysteine protease
MMSRLYKSTVLFIFICLTITFIGCQANEGSGGIFDEAKQAIDEFGVLVDDIIEVIEEGEVVAITPEPVEWSLEENVEPTQTPPSENNPNSESQIDVVNDIIQDYLFVDQTWFYDDTLYTMLEAILNNESTLTIEAKDTDYFDNLCDSLYVILSKTYYKYCIDGIRWSSNGQTITINITYNDEAVRQTNEMLEKSKDIASRLFTGTMTDVEKVVAAYDYIQLNTKYDEQAADQIEGGTYSAAHNGYGSLIEGEAVCEGYAGAFNAILNADGIETRLIESSAMNHVWSMVKVNDAWYNCDVTFDDKTPDTKNNADYDYLLKNDDFMIADDSNRNVTDKPISTGQDYHYEIYSSQWYNINNVEYIYKLVDGTLVRDNVSDYQLDLQDGQVLATDVNSWIGIPNDYLIVYVEQSTNQLLTVDFDGKNQRQIGTFTGQGIVLSAESVGDTYVLTCTTSINGSVTKINVDK